MKKLEKNKTKIAYGIFVLAVVMIVVGMVVVNLALNAKLSQKKIETGEDATYKYHVAMIGRNPSDVFWQSLYEGAKKQGIRKNVFVENFGAELAQEYTAEEIKECEVKENGKRRGNSLLWTNANCGYERKYGRDYYRVRISS